MRGNCFLIHAPCPMMPVAYGGKPSCSAGSPMPHPSVLFNFSLALQQNAKVGDDWCKNSAYWLSYIENPENSGICIFGIKDI